MAKIEAQGGFDGKDGGPHGFLCDFCLAYGGDIEDEKHRRRFTDGLAKYNGSRLTLEECLCEGRTAKRGD